LALLASWLNTRLESVVMATVANLQCSTLATFYSSHF
jgi:hypothetical protein